MEKIEEIEEKRELSPIEREAWKNYIVDFQNRHTIAKGKMNCKAEDFVFFRTERGSIHFGCPETIECGRDNRPTIRWKRFRRHDEVDYFLGTEQLIIFEEWLNEGKVIEKKIDGMNTTDCLWKFAK